MNTPHHIDPALEAVKALGEALHEASARCSPEQLEALLRAALQHIGRDPDVSHTTPLSAEDMAGLTGYINGWLDYAGKQGLA